MQIEDKNIEFKFVCKKDNDNNIIWEEGCNRILNSKKVDSLPKTKDGKYILECKWNHFKVDFVVYYNLDNIKYDMLLIIASNETRLKEKLKSLNKISNEKEEKIPIKANLENDCLIFKVDFENSEKNYFYL